MRSLTETEAKRLLRAAASRPAHQRLVLRLLLEYELTAHEICRLTGGDVDGSAIRVRDKRDRDRTVHLCAEAAAELARVAAASESDQLLAGRSGPLRPDAIRRLLIAAALDAGLDAHVSIHRTRRSVDARA